MQCMLCQNLTKPESPLPLCEAHTKQLTAEQYAKLYLIATRQMMLRAKMAARILTYLPQ